MPGMGKNVKRAELGPIDISDTQVYLPVGVTELRDPLVGKNFFFLQKTANQSLTRAAIIMPIRFQLRK